MEPLEAAPTEGGWLYKLMTRFIAWGFFTGFLVMVLGLILFIGLAIYRGIIWLWPGGAV